MFRPIIVVPFYLLLSAAQAVAASPPVCSPSDIDVVQAGYHRSEMRLVAEGEIRNRCALASGVQLQATYRDATGKIVATNAFWMGYKTNVPPGAASSFVTVDEDPGGILSLSVQVNAVGVWKLVPSSNAASSAATNP